MTPRDSLAVLYRADIRYALHSARGVLLLVFYGVFWAWVFTKLGGWAKALASPEAGMVASMLSDDQDLLRLVHTESATMATFFWMAISATPVFATLAGCDQTASDLASKHLRFLIPRAGRGSIYLARFLGAATLLAVVQVIATVIAVFVALSSDSTSTPAVLWFALRIAVVLVLYSVAFVALYAPLTAAIPSPATVALAGLGTYAVLVILAATVESRWPWAANVLFLTPGGFKSQLFDSGLTSALTAVGGLAVQSLVYLAIGWRVFRGRDA